MHQLSEQDRAQVSQDLVDQLTQLDTIGDQLVDQLESGRGIMGAHMIDQAPDCAGVDQS